MRVVFMGTPDFAVPSLNALVAADFTPVAVVTQPDRPRGRGRHLLPSPVKERATELELPLVQPKRVREPEFIRQLAELELDLIVVVAFGQILPLDLLNLPRLGCINVHASLLPRLRGAAPIQRAIMNGDKITGVTTMHMAEALDSGDIILQEKEEIMEDDTAGTLARRLAERGAALLVRTIQALAAGKAPRLPQDHDAATYAPPLTKSDEVLDFTRPARELANQVRALNPAPGAMTYVDGKALKVWRARPQEAASGAPGQVLAVKNLPGILVGTGLGGLLLEEVQPAGKRSMTAQAFANGYQVQPGDLWGQEVPC
ncbi:MAG: methionyl-tRNA formyltransferase [Firmicutes bacterium]|jgi:methionyl-tRNA formyltransferase|nr:methionyl-tRNA formyltransferase [Bacillota bacterium]